MNSLELFALLKKQAESILITDEVRPATDSLPIEYELGSSEYASECMRRYNYEAYLEITNPETIVVLSNVDNEVIVEFESILDAYMEAYAPNRSNLKNYIKLVSLYLAFVARRPLHPPLIMAPERHKGAIKKSGQYCIVGNADLDGRFPICQYCVAYLESNPMKK